MDEVQRKRLEDRLRQMLQRLKEKQKQEKSEKPAMGEVDEKGVIRRRRGKPDKRISGRRKDRSRETTC